MAGILSDPSTIRAEAPKASQSLARCLEALSARRFDASDVSRLIQSFNRPETWHQVASWDEAAQLYLALGALRQSWVAMGVGPSVEQERLKVRLNEVHSKLMFPEGFDSPRNFDSSWLRGRVAE